MSAAEASVDSRGWLGGRQGKHPTQTYAARTEVWSTFGALQPHKRSRMQQEVNKLQRKVGELVMDIDILKEAMKGHPFAPKMPDES